MPTVLKNVLRFSGLAIGVSVASTHGLNFNARSLAPKNVWLNGGGYNVTADATNVVIERTPSGQADVDVAVELWHSYEDAEPMPGGIASSVMPFIMQGAGGGSGAGAGAALAAGTQTAATGTVVFSNSNGFTFGLSGSSQLTLSGDAFRSVIAQGSTATGPTFSFANGNGITFGMNGQTLTASVQTVGGTATGVAISAGTEVATTGAVVFSNSNGITFGLNAQTLTASFYRPSVQTVIGFTATGGETRLTVTFAAVANTSYAVAPTNAGVASIVGWDAPKGSRSTTAFIAEPTNALVSNDVFEFVLFAS